MLVKLFFTFGFVSILLADPVFRNWERERDTSRDIASSAEPPSMTKPEEAPMDDSMKAFWIVFGVTVVIFVLAVLVVVVIFRQRVHFGFLYKRKAQTLQDNQQEQEFAASSRTNQSLLV